MASSYLIAAGSLIIALLGAVHLTYTFFSGKFESRDADLNRRLREVSPVITRETTMWRAWVGFNASHSLGALLFGVLYAYLALVQYSVLISSWFLMALSIAVLVSYIVLARAYWFRAPLAGISVATLLIVTGYLLARL